MILKTIEVPTNCDIYSLISFLNGKNMEPIGIHRLICKVLGDLVSFEQQFDCPTHVKRKCTMKREMLSAAIYEMKKIDICN